MNIIYNPFLNINPCILSKTYLNLSQMKNSYENHGFIRLGKFREARKVN